VRGLPSASFTVPLNFTSRGTVMLAVPAAGAAGADYAHTALTHPSTTNNVTAHTEGF